MKKKLLLLVTAMLLAAMAVSALAEAPAAGSLKVERQVIDGNSVCTAESYPEVWITPYFAEYILQGKEDYPAVFMRFAPPEGALAQDFDYDDAFLINFDTLTGYSYAAYDRLSFEVFLEKAEEDGILADGSDGVAMYVNADSNRGNAMIDIKETFGKTSKLTIDVYDYSRKLSQDELKEKLQEEVERVRAAMTIETLDHYWAAGVFESVQLANAHDPVLVTVDTSELNVIAVDDKKITYETPIDERNVEKVEVNLDTYSNPYYNEDESTEVTLSDGTVMRVKTTDYTGYAGVPVLDEVKIGSGPLYLSITITATPDVFMEKLEEVWARVTVETK